MSQLINITTDSFQAVRFTQHARLVPEQSLDVERRKALARHYAFTSRNQNSPHIGQVSQINSAFAGQSVSASVSKNTAAGMVSMSSSAQIPQTQIVSPADVKASAVISQPARVSAPQSDSNFSSTAPKIPAAPTVSESSYHAQRGSFEMRVANGSLSYVPELAMTIVTQRPEVHVEYIGGFNYFPDSAAPENQQLNLFI